MPTRVERFYSLDVLRGVAALSVVFWHWQHFFYNGSAHSNPLERMPLIDVFFLLYGKGWLAVELFFSLSGFVFFWLYAQPIAAARVPARDFFLLRFSRLYPLHLATLLTVVAGQLLYYGLAGTYFVYQRNDGYHFALNLFFVSSWGFERGWSFNAPVWSVSVEVFLYLAFFIFCRLLPVRLLSLAAMVAIGFLVVRPLYEPLGRGIGGFYLGGCMYFAYEWLAARGHARSLGVVLGCASAALWIVSALVVRDYLYGTGIVALAPLQSIDGYWPTVLLTFPLTLLALALIEHSRGSLGRRAAFLGDISYSSYMLHFPLQLAFALVAVAGSFDRALFASTQLLLVFFAVLIALSLASHRYFERPMQHWLRGMRPLRLHEARH
jgi:peptidoglycan/LPS O-acetylase OafA/YrhL